MTYQGKGQSVRGSKDDLHPEDEEEEQIDDDLAADMLNDNVSPAASLQLAEQLKGLPESADEPAGYFPAQLISFPDTEICCCSCDEYRGSILPCGAFCRVSCLVHSSQSTIHFPSLP